MLAEYTIYNSDRKDDHMDDVEGLVEFDLVFEVSN